MQRITIVGGGIAGLALAAALEPAGRHVTLIERRPGLPVTGTSLAIWPTAEAALRRLGAFEGLAAVSPSIDRFPIARADGRDRVVSEVPTSVLAGRRDLLGALDAAVPDSVERVVRHVERFDPDDPAFSADVVVGADGVHSAVRRAAWGDAAAAVTTPYLAVRGVLPHETPSEEWGEYWGRGRLYGIGPHRDGTNWYTSFRSNLGPREVDVRAALDEARTGSRDILPSIARVLDEADPDRTLAQRIITGPRLRSYVRGRTVLVGDAAHAMTPNLGRGGCEAIVDAVTLAGLLDALPVDEALARYDAERVRPTKRLAGTSGLVMRIALADRAQPVRDGLLRAVGALRARRAPTPARPAEPVR
ncbi:FAD-dependent monooxygenase [Agromyces aurantiacus]|uniref:FAD-dependent monooxygenase n=1 Tax=Agromyces aurantiacus TaxID=165814 RepID=A0ABV9R269_9MICO|nr:FAD-dependent monooxygenase [Agromyces aurantiacus]MBM7505640.1 2-polyprenyl-6-methoxyphenol hydroxylase-like FAD-dependent oxidoreductase [Agromyces aurantiacus]